MSLISASGVAEITGVSTAPLPERLFLMRQNMIFQARNKQASFVIVVIATD
jgi:hypothetical protein